jgi:hypothetical protein
VPPPTARRPSRLRRGRLSSREAQCRAWGASTGGSAATSVPPDRSTPSRHRPPHRDTCLPQCTRPREVRAAAPGSAPSARPPP